MARRRRTREALWWHCRTVPLFKRFYLIFTHNIGCCAPNQNISFNSCYLNWSPSGPGETAKLNQNHCRTHNTNHIIISQRFWHSHLRPLITINQIVTSQQGTALTILAMLKGTDAEIGSAWVQQHVKTFAEGFLSQVTVHDWSADQANKILSGPPVGWVLHSATTRLDGLLEVEYIIIYCIIYYHYIIIFIILYGVSQKKRNFRIAMNWPLMINVNVVAGSWSEEANSWQFWKCVFWDTLYIIVAYFDYISPPYLIFKTKLHRQAYFSSGQISH